MAEYLILTDEKDQFVGMMEKLMVHKLGLLHRAFSIFIFNSRGEMLLQQRAYDKYHSGGLWSNACCSHPRFEERIPDAVNRRLWEEMGIQADTDFAFSFTYRATLENDLTEHEYDHVYVGITDAIPNPDKREVHSWKYISLQALQDDMKKHPANYTEWFKLCIPELIKHYSQSYLQRHTNIHSNVSI
jgi:isopentenyl-diphosphate delta-isomerase